MPGTPSIIDGQFAKFGSGKLWPILSASSAIHKLSETGLEEFNYDLPERDFWPIWLWVAQLPSGS